MVKEGEYFRLGRQRRGFSPRDNRLKDHVLSRHYHDEEGCVDLRGYEIGRTSATQFPSSLKPGDITRIRRWLETEWNKYAKGYPCQIIDFQPAGDAFRISGRLDRFGLKEVGGFVRGGVVVTVFPEEANGNSFLKDGSGRRFKKRK